MYNTLFQKRPLRDSVPKMVPKWPPKWLHFQLFSALVFDPLFEPPPNFIFCPNRPAERSPRDRKGEKGIPKRSPNATQTLRCRSIFALLEPPGGPEASRNTQDLIFIDSGSIFAPQASVLSVFGSHFRPARAQAPPRTAKNRQEPAETQNPQRHTAPNFADRRTAPPATKRRARIRGAAVCTPHGVFNNLEYMLYNVD